MQIGIDGCCKWGGTPECVSAGVACILTEQGEIKYLHRVEPNSTSQRGELSGLLLALSEAAQTPETEDIIIVTDSEYLYNTVSKDWLSKWQDNAWVGSAGTCVKNVDLWRVAAALLDSIGRDRIYMQWTKGHLVSGITPTAVKAAFAQDATGLQLYDNIQTVVNRPSEYDRIVAEFNRHRKRNQQMTVPAEVACDWVVMNVFADLTAEYIKKTIIEAGRF